MLDEEKAKIFIKYIINLSRAVDNSFDYGVMTRIAGKETERFLNKSLEKILTPGRMELLRTITEKKPKSVGELAKSVKRPLESVSRDLGILTNYGLLSLIKVGKTKKPEIEKDMLMIPLKT